MPLGEVSELGTVRERVDELADVAGVPSRQISVFADPTAATSARSPLVPEGARRCAAACAGMLCVRAAFHTARGLVFLHDRSVPEFGYFTWQIIVPSAAAILTAAAVAVLGERRYYLLRALVAAGIAALLGFGAEYLLGAVDGCLGALNVQTPVCLWLPAAPWPEDESELGFVFGLALVLSGVAALVAASVRRRAVVPGRHAPARVLRHGNSGLVVRRVAIAVLGMTTASLIVVDTVQSTAGSSAPAIPFTTARQIERPPATVQETPQTARLQTQAWLGFGGHRLLLESSSAVSAFSHAINDMVRAGPRRYIAAFKKEVPPACAGFVRLVQNADGYFAVPVGAGQRLCREAVADLRTTADGCHNLVRHPTDATLDDEVADMKKAAAAVAVFADWVQRVDPNRTIAERGQS